MTKLRMIVLASSNRLAYAARNGKLMMVGARGPASFRYAALSCRVPARRIAREASPPAPPQPRLLDRVRPLSAEPLAR